MERNVSHENHEIIHPTELLKGKELAALLHVSPALVSAWAKEGCPVVYMGKVKESKRGACPRYRLAEVMAWLEQRNEKEVQA